MTIGHEPSRLYNFMLVIGGLLILSALFWGITGYNSRDKAKREASYTSDVREWCKQQDGIAMYKGDTYSWDCILIEGGK